MTEKQLSDITTKINYDIVRNSDVMYSAYNKVTRDEIDDVIWMLQNTVCTLHNLLYKEVTGEPYDYWFHWANKIGRNVDENCFTDIGVDIYDTV